MRCLALSLSLLVLVASSSATRADGLVELERWRATAVLIPNRGPGEVLFNLRVEAHWDRSAPREPGRYAVRLTLPDRQTTTRSLPPGEGPGSRQVTVLVPADSVRNMRPDRVVVRAVIVDTATGAEVSNPLNATIANFPTPGPRRTRDDLRPFGWGRPLQPGSGRATVLPRAGPDGLVFAHVPAGPSAPAFFLARTEATNHQVGSLLKGYDPRANRSDEFALEDPDQPALNLSPERAERYLDALGAGDRGGVRYRLPTREEWLHAARAGQDTAFWWGDAPTFPDGANFLGPEPALEPDTTAPSHPSASSGSFHPNPFGLFHTFGNVAEWATAGPGGGFARLGGNFRTEPESPLPEPIVGDTSALGDDPFVGVRPAFDLSARTGSDLARRALGDNPGWSGVRVAFDPDRATVTLTGRVDDPALRRQADRRLGGLWWVAAVENRIVTPSVGTGALARLGPLAGPVRRITPLGRRLDEIPVSVRWSSPLPVAGSSWYANLYLPGGAHLAHALNPIRPGIDPTVVFVLDRTGAAAAALPEGATLRVALSLGAPAPEPGDPRVVTNAFEVPLGGP